MKYLKRNIILILILSLGFFLRIYKVTSVPPSLNWDEVSIAYNAYSILKTGKDEWGKTLPLHFKSYGEYKLPAQIYASIPAIAIFGLNDFGVRITPVIYGTLTILLLYLLVQEAFGKKMISLTAAFFLSVSPWHIQLTRASFESSFAVFWVLLGIWFFLKGLKKSKWLLASMLPFAVSVYTYNTARVFTPLFLVALALLFWKRLWVMKKWFLGAGAIFAVLMVPLVPFVLSGEASARYKLVSITDEKGLVPRINERRGASKLPGILPRLIHNKVTYLSFYFAENYLAHFSPNFLFISGAPHHQHSVQGVGELYWLQAPLIILGLYFLFKKKDEHLKWLLPWLFLTFIPVAMTNDSIPNALRTVIAAPAYAIFSACGFYYLVTLFKNKKQLTILGSISVLIFVINFAILLHQLFIVYPVKYSRDWQYGYKEVVNYIAQNQNKYDLVTFSRTYGEPHMFTLFYLKYDPAGYQNSPNLNRYETFDWVWVLRFDKYYFPDLGDKGTQYKDVIAANAGKKILFIGKPGDFPPEAKILRKVDFLDGSGAFVITEN